MSEAAEAPRPPMLRVVKGEPTDDELVALVTVIAARRAAAAEAVRAAKPRRRSAWGDPARAVRPPHSHGPGGWRASAFPG
ncbi:acyl-CoA carboxylase subunit epsilon [Solicola sp. PLA-1-18]|uniref:acyl-CoA carboxylase subunit epsilon n=1 Tax=Solicola sp. PLA-1-18 TaxID=3380532 RepID=UPI003B82145F